MTLTRDPAGTLDVVVPFGSALEQIEAELRWLVQRLRVVVERGWRRRSLGPSDEYRGLYVSDEEIDDLLAAGDEQATDLEDLQRSASAWRAHLDARAAATLDAGVVTPLDRVARACERSPPERRALRATMRSAPLRAPSARRRG